MIGPFCLVSEMKSVQFTEKLNRLVIVTICFLLLAPALSAQQSRHRFWDKTNIILHSANAAAQTADAISTQRLDDIRFPERTPFGIGLSRPFVEAGWKGQVVVRELADNLPQVPIISTEGNPENELRAAQDCNMFHRRFRTARARLR